MILLRFSFTQIFFFGWLWIKPFLGGTAYLNIVELYQKGPVNYLMGGFRCDLTIDLKMDRMSRVSNEK